MRATDAARSSVAPFVGSDLRRSRAYWLKDLVSTEEADAWADESAGCTGVRVAGGAELPTPTAHFSADFLSCCCCFRTIAEKRSRGAPAFALPPGCISTGTVTRGVNDSHRTRERPFVCGVEGCGKAFSSTSYLDIHARIHVSRSAWMLPVARIHVSGPARSVTCNVEGCGKTWPTISALVAHKRTLTAETPCVCDVEGCGKPFRTMYALGIHKRSHSRERPFACDVEGCGKPCPTMSALFSHERVHTGKRPFVCDVEGCDKVFASNRVSILHRHAHMVMRPSARLVEGCRKA